MDWLTRLAEESNFEQAVSDCYTAALDAGDAGDSKIHTSILAPVSPLTACVSCLVPFGW